MADPNAPSDLLTPDELARLQEVGSDWRGAPVAAGDAETKSKLLKNYADLLKASPNADPVQLGRTLGLSDTDIAAFRSRPDQARQLLPDVPDYKESASMQQRLVEADEAQSRITSGMRSAVERADALRRIEEDAGAELGQIGGGVVNALARAVDRNLEPLGIDIVRGEQRDIQILDAGAVFDIGEVAQLWKGAISDFENRLFQQTAGSSDKDPRFIRNKLTQQIMAGASNSLRSIMADELEQVTGKKMLPSTAMLNGSAVKTAVDYIREKYQLPDPSAFEPGSREAESAAREWAEWSSSGDNAILIRGAILMANATKGVGNMDDPESIKTFISQGYLPDGYSGVTLNGDVAQPLNDADVAAVSEQAAANATESSIDTGVTSDFETQEEAAAYLQGIPREQWPARVKIGGKTYEVGVNQ